MKFIKLKLWTLRNFHLKLLTFIFSGVWTLKKFFALKMTLGVRRLTDFQPIIIDLKNDIKMC